MGILCKTATYPVLSILRLFPVQRLRHRGCTVQFRVQTTRNNPAFGPRCVLESQIKGEVNNLNSGQYSRFTVVTTASHPLKTSCPVVDGLGTWARRATFAVQLQERKKAQNQNWPVQSDLGRRVFVGLTPHALCLF